MKSLSLCLVIVLLPLLDAAAQQKSLPTPRLQKPAPNEKAQAEPPEELTPAQEKEQPPAPGSAVEDLSRLKWDMAAKGCI